MYERILFATDGSPVSEAAASDAARLAGSLGAALRIVHVIDTVDFSRDSEFENLDDLAAPLRDRGARILEHASGIVRDAGVNAETHLIELDHMGTRVDEAIVGEAQRWNADLIVVGSHGRRGVRRWMLGSVAEHVVRSSDRPVLLMHNSTQAT